MNVLELCRRTRRLTQAQVAEGTGIHQVRISEYERGLRPTPAHLRTLASFFGLPAGAAGKLMAEVPADVAAVPAPPDMAQAIRDLRSRS